jgi:hypothetical protein
MDRTVVASGSKKTGAAAAIASVVALVAMKVGPRRRRMRRLTPHRPRP